MISREVTYTNFDNIEMTYIEITNLDGSMTTFAKDETNPAYQAYLDRDKPKAALSTPSLPE